MPGKEIKKRISTAYEHVHANPFYWYRKERNVIEGRKKKSSYRKERNVIEGRKKKSSFSGYGKKNVF